jgi:hypothetical protein
LAEAFTFDLRAGDVILCGNESSVLARASVRPKCTAFAAKTPLIDICVGVHNFKDMFSFATFQRLFHAGKLIAGI